MNSLKHRIRNIENIINSNNSNKEICLNDLLQPEYVYNRGKQFIGIYEACEYLGITELPPYIDNTEHDILHEKGILKYSRDEIRKCFEDNI
jgi:hypothetical protein